MLCPVALYHNIAVIQTMFCLSLSTIQITLFALLVFESRHILRYLHLTKYLSNVLVEGICTLSFECIRSRKCKMFVFSLFRLFRLFSNNLRNKNWRHSGIRTWIVRIEGKHVDDLTTTTAHVKYLFVFLLQSAFSDDYLCVPRKTRKKKIQRECFMFVLCKQF